VRPPPRSGTTTEGLQGSIQTRIYGAARRWLKNIPVRVTLDKQHRGYSGTARVLFIFLNFNPVPGNEKHG
jgi:hypothetical protein